MKKESSLFISLLVILSLINLRCFREKEIEFEAINQIIPSIIDSISINKSELNSTIHFYILDTLLKPLDSCRINYAVLEQSGIIINDIKLNEKEKCKLEFQQDTYKDTSLFSVISSLNDFNKVATRDSISNVLLAFSRVYFNHERKEGFFILLEYIKPKAAREYVVYCIKKRNYWVISRIVLSGIC